MSEHVRTCMCARVHGCTRVVNIIHVFGGVCQWRKPGQAWEGESEIIYIYLYTFLRPGVQGKFKFLCFVCWSIIIRNLKIYLIDWLIETWHFSTGHRSLPGMTIDHTVVCCTFIELNCIFPTKLLSVVSVIISDWLNVTTVPRHCIYASQPWWHQ